MPQSPSKLERARTIRVVDDAKTNRFNQCLKKALLSPMRVTCGTLDNPLTSEQDSIDFHFQTMRGQANFVNKTKAGKLPNILLQSSGSEIRENDLDEPHSINILNQKQDGA